MTKAGALPKQLIQNLIDSESILGPTSESVRPGSLDLRMTDEVYRVNASFLPSRSETVTQAIKRAGGFRLKGEKILLERGFSYVIRLREKVITLPDGVYAFCNPKSSSGRVDVHVRTIVDYSSRYDVVTGKKGDLWLLVVPKTFSVYVQPDLSLNQIRFFTQDTRLDELGLQMYFNSDGGLLFNKGGEKIGYENLEHSDKDGAILLTLGLDFQQPGFQALATGEPIDLSFLNAYDPRYFFEEIRVRDNAVTLQPDRFYILSTREYVRVPVGMACEMRPMDERSGEHRSHYAGFIDPGWGIGRDGKGCGRPLTLEVRTFDSRVLICHGQPVAKVRYERMYDIPSEHYDEMAPTYGDQSGPKLAKNFSEWK